MRKPNQTIGFIGLGVMGKPMSLNLIKAGYSLVVYDISPEPVGELISAGAREGNSPAHVAEQSDVIFTMLPDSPQVKKFSLVRKEFYWEQIQDAFSLI